MSSWVRRFIYFPDDRVVPAVPPHGEAVTLPSDGLTLAAWLLPAAGGTGVVVCNGNAGNREDRLPLTTGLQQRGFSVLSLDYRGYGGNPGSPTEEGMIADAAAAADYLASLPGISRVAYFGESLGAAVLIGLAERRPPGALVLRSPFTSLLDMARAHLPLVPKGVIEDTWDSIGRIARIEVPVLVVAGTADTVVPYSQSVRLFEAAAGPARLVTFEGADHNDASLAYGRRLLDETARFLAEVLPAD